MTTAQQVGAVIVLAELAVFILVLGPALRKYLAVRRDCDREWADLTAQVEAARADFDREPLIDRIARDHLAGFFDEWQQQVESEVAE